jgi:hypothetical protein
MIRRYNLSHPAGQPMPEDWLDLPDSVVAAADYDALVVRLAEVERLLLVARDCLRTAHNGWAETLGREIDAFLGATAVQPERCCADYPRCDCNSPPEPDNEWHCSQYPGCECFAGCREKALERQREPLDYFEEGIADALGYYNEKRVRMPGFNDSGRCVMSGIKYEKLTGKDLIAALRGGACGDLLEDAAYAAADEIERLRGFIEGLPDGDEIERLQKILQKIMARCAVLLDEDQFNELDAMVTQAIEHRN